jgi:hypothetical protein
MRAFFHCEYEKLTQGFLQSEKWLMWSSRAAAF